MPVSVLLQGDTAPEGYWLHPMLAKHCSMHMFDSPSHEGKVYNCVPRSVALNETLLELDSSVWLFPTVLVGLPLQVPIYVVQARND